MGYNTPQQLAEEFSKTATVKDAYTLRKLGVYSLLGGAFVALGGLLSIITSGGMPEVSSANPGIAKLVSGAVFPLGLILVLLGGAELFTSDCAVMAYSYFNKQTKLYRLLRIWFVAYVGNFVGALIVAYLFAYQTEILSVDPWLSSAKKIGQYKTSHSFSTTFIKGIGANWLVCLAVWLSYSAKDVTGKILAMWFPIMCFVAFGFEHSIANMFFIPTSILLGADITMYEFFIVNLLPATLGNIVGGALFLAIPYWYMFSYKKPEMEEFLNVQLNSTTTLNMPLSKTRPIKSKANQLVKSDN
ncbi:formate/nitrite transporter family protein [Aridibaculum aurantiacum]|uniref:formate/nitrite transporter family protein n=1 Tax=Aridibaculum aurantiacum TaxID=2810307 RepID=UPI001A95FE88|nr:formate/nitrite transporter family protein [Aridibaculum aurantiacum]